MSGERLTPNDAEPAAAAGERGPFDIADRVTGANMGYFVGALNFAMRRDGEISAGAWNACIAAAEEFGRLEHGQHDLLAEVRHEPESRREDQAEALRKAAGALEAMPPKLRAQYVSLLRLYAAEPWRLGL